MIEAKNLKKIYKTKTGVTVNALDDVSVKLPDKGMVFILGKSGSGKSTLLNVLGGLDSFDAGEIIIKGTSAKDFKQSHYDSYRNTYIGFIFQEYNILDELTVGANVALAIELQGRRATDSEINEILKEVDLEGYGARKPNELSGGQKQRVAIARALVKRPEIIMADEPTGALDSATGRQVFDTLKKLSRDKLVLIVSHDREFSEQYADRIIELADGKIISDVEKVETTDDTPVSIDQPLTFLDGEISVKAGYTLTEEDRLQINAFLSEKTTDTVIKVRRTRKANVPVFRPTDETNIKNDKKGDFKLIKSRLSLKNAFKLGTGALNHKKVRLVFTIFLSFISFTLFGLADTIAAYDSIRTATTSIYDTGVPYASYIKLTKWGEEGEEYWNSNGTLLKDEDIEIIKEKTGYNVVGVYCGRENTSFHNYLGKDRLDDKDASRIYPTSFSGIAEINQSLIDENGFTLLEGSRLPEDGKNEIVITKYVYDYFAICGYTNGTDEFDISSPSDLIGKIINVGIMHNNTTEYKIVGIVDTNFDLSPYEKLADPNASFDMNEFEIMFLSSELQSAQEYSFACVGFVDNTVLSSIVSSDNSSFESLDSRGGLSIYVVRNDNFENEWEVGGSDGTNIISQLYVGSLGSLSNLRDSVVWLKEPIDELKDNQVIISLGGAHNFAGERFNYPEGYFDTSLLSEHEQSLLEMANSMGEIQYVSPSAILENPKYFCALRYAEENKRNENNNKIINRICEHYGWNYEEYDSNIKNTAQRYAYFADLTVAGYCDDIVTDEYFEKYINDIISRVRLSDYIVPKEISDKFIGTYEYKGKTYRSTDDKLDRIYTYEFLYNNADRYISRKYASEHLEDAIEYYRTMYNKSEDDMRFAPIEDIVNTYADVFLGKSDADLSYDEYISYHAEIMTDFYKGLIPSDEKIVITANSYNSPWSEIVRNCEIVGLVPISQDMYGNASAIVSERIVDQLLGVNRGGIYAYAVGNMPTDMQSINDIVKFYKTYVNSKNTAKYDLINNVTSQLSMVDELLEILGKVFLYVGLGFALFASLMLTNFISTSIAHKKQDIGILRAIGSRSSDVFRIFFAESFVIAMINFVLSVVGTLAVTIVLNTVIRNDAGLLITFLNFGVRQILVLFGVSLIVALLATFFPVRKIASMKPIDAIKNRK